MFESTPIIIVGIIILSSLIGGIIGNSLSRVSQQKKGDSQIFHVDKTTGIVSDATSIKYSR